MAWGRCDCHGMKYRFCPSEGRRASGKADWEPRGQGRPMSPKSQRPAAQPRACGKACGPYDRATGYRATCTGTIRGGHCPCPDC